MLPVKAWRVIIHRLVISEDFKKVDLPDRKLILKAIWKKLSRDPEAYGMPLAGEYKGYWKLRVGDHRVIYRIVKEKVLVIVIKIGIRRDEEVYKKLIHRLRKL